MPHKLLNSILFNFDNFTSMVILHMNSVLQPVMKVWGNQCFTSATRITVNSFTPRYSNKVNLCIFMHTYKHKNKRVSGCEWPRLAWREENYLTILRKISISPIIAHPGKNKIAVEKC